MKRKIYTKKKQTPRVFRSKKGMHMFFLLSGAILMAVVIVIFIFFLLRIQADAKEQALDSRCQKSVVSYSRLKELPVPTFVSGGTAREENIDCPTRYITIPKDDANKQRRVVAELMKKCWYNFGEGKLTLFGQGQTFCHICSVFQFEDKKTVLKDFPFFLMTQRPGIKRDGRQVTYMEYFTDKLPSQELLESLKEKDNTALLGNQRYAIIFTYFKKESPSFWAKLGAGALIGLGGAVGIGITLVTAGTATAATAALIGSASGLGLFSVGAIGAYMSSEPKIPKAAVVLTPYDTESIKKLKCAELPVSQMDKKFR